MLFTLFASAQEQDKYGVGSVPVKDGVVTFTTINEISTKTKDQLYSSAKMMIAEMFKSAKDVIQSDDKDSGVIICKGNAKIPKAFITYLMEFTLKISCKDGKYKADLYDITLQIGCGDPNPIFQNCNETIIDEVAMKNGEIKKNGGGKQRRIVIDKKDEIFETIKQKMSNTSVEENW